jgi:hypothetical protein
MELGPIPRIREVGPATAPRDERDVQPPFALGASGRMGDDAYKGRREEGERGLEEEDSENVEETERLSASPSDSSGPQSEVDCFA